MNTLKVTCPQPEAGPTRSATRAAGNVGGVRVAADDVNGDGRADVMTGAGPSGGPHVKVIDVASFSELQSFFGFADAFLGGVHVG